MAKQNGQRRRALITGASAGLGEGFARHLARDNYDLVLIARRRDRLDALASELPVSCEIIDVDLTKTRSVALVEERAATGDVDLLVNNAGFGTYGEFSKAPLNRELEELDLNVRALMRLCHAALGPMVDKRSGGIINVASTAAFQPIPYNATYAATKAFVLHFSEALHEETRRQGVTVTCVCPGPVHTEFQDVAGIDTSRVPSLAWTTVDTVVNTALAALRGGRAIAIPGPFNIATAASTRLVPRFMTRRIAAAFFRDRGAP
jgi:hypothetical protein